MYLPIVVIVFDKYTSQASSIDFKRLNVRYRFSVRDINIYYDLRHTNHLLIVQKSILLH